MIDRTLFPHSEIVAPYILPYGTDAQKQKYLPLLASGGMIGAIHVGIPDHARLRRRAGAKDLRRHQRIMKEVISRGRGLAPSR